MPPVKSPQASADKWERASAAATQDYIDGVRNPRKDWAQRASAAESNYKAGVTAAAAAGRYGKGVNRAGTQKWQQRTLSVGADRWAPGVAAAKDNWIQGFSPYAQVIERTELPARGPKGDPKNIQRVSVLSKALHDAKVNRT